MSNDYLQYRGKCKEMCDTLVENDPTLTLVRGHYWCPLWGMQQHWWCEDDEGNIIDPSVKQFPTKGFGAEYLPHDGTVSCEYCGKDIHEEEAYFVDHHVYCSYEHYGRDIGF